LTNTSTLCHDVRRWRSATELSPPIAGSLGLPLPEITEFEVHNYLTAG